MLSPFPWQADQWRQLQAAHAQQRLPHALLFSGPEGIGLEQFAYSLAASLLCRDRQDRQMACGMCKSCLLFQAGNHPDLIDLQPEEKGKQIKVDAVRDLIDYIHMKSQYNDYKLAIINPAHAMNRSAANSLLKTLEEPPASSLIILISTQAAQLPVTIRSRCQRLNFPARRDGETLGWLQEKLKHKNLDVEELLITARGLPLKALELANTEELAQHQSLLADLEELRAGHSNPVKMAEKWLGLDAGYVVMQLLDYLNLMARLKIGAPGNNSTEHRHLQRMINGLDLVQLINCHDVLLQHYYALTGPISLNKQGLLEDFIITWQSMTEQPGG